MEHRVVITGMGAVSPYGESTDTLWRGLTSGTCAIKPLETDLSAHGVTCSVAATVPAIDPRRIPRPLRRSMSPMSIYAYLAAEEALQQAGLNKLPRARTGVCVGTTIGSPVELTDFFTEFITTGTVDTIYSTAFFKAMGHTTAANLSTSLQCTGRQIAPAAACASGLVGIGLGYETIRFGREQKMLCGGADEFHVLAVASFDRMGALSPAKDPLLASRPFDADRTGLVCGEGAGIVLLESLESAQERGAEIFAEISGFASTSSFSSLAYPDVEAVENCMAEALADAHITAQDVGYVNAHATGTEAGDAVEGMALGHMFGDTPTSSLKGHIGHTLAASGSLETIACVNMLRSGLLLPTLGLKQPDTRCGTCHPLCTPVTVSPKIILKNSFAMGGVYASLVLKQWTI